MSLQAQLEAGREDFLDAVRNVTTQDAASKPHATGWSVLECIEHVVTAEDRYLRWIADGATIPPAPDPEKEFRLFTMVRSRLSKVSSPAALKPRARFESLSDALTAFCSVRDRSIAFAQKPKEQLCALTARHPFFGKLNGAEWIQVIDAHARRHADHIREIISSLRSEPSTISMKAARTTKSAVFKRDEPDLPRELGSLQDPEAQFSGREVVELSEVRLENLEKPTLKAASLALEGCVLEGVSLRDAEIGSAVWKDVRLTGCDFANSRIRRLVLTRVELIDCRLTGLRADAIEWQDVLIQDSDLQYSQLPGARFRNCEFRQCNWTESDVQNADLSGSIFASCNLSRADFQGANLKSTDLRGSNVDGLTIGVQDLRGAIVNPAQAMVLAKLLGLEIR